MLKMLMDPMGGIVMTNDGNAILREVSLEQHLLQRNSDYNIALPPGHTQLSLLHVERAGGPGTRRHVIDITSMSKLTRAQQTIMPCGLEAFTA